MSRSFRATMASYAPRAYAWLLRAGITETAWFAALYEPAYAAYKRLLEDPFSHLAARRPELFAGGHILDVGANIGYTALVFARVVHPGHLVYAFEPETRNHAALVRAAARHAPGRVVPLRFAVGEHSGLASLAINRSQPADHRVVVAGIGHDLGLETESVPMTTLDEFIGQVPSPEVAFVKIDVQGFELAVCRGMQRVLSDNPAVVVALEYSRGGIASMGSDPDELLRLFESRGFHAHRIHHTGELEAVAFSALRAESDLASGYENLAFSRRPLAGAAAHEGTRPGG